MPPYHDQDIPEAIQIYIQLNRTTDNAVSELVPFTYMPRDGKLKVTSMALA